MRKGTITTTAAVLAFGGLLAVGEAARSATDVILGVAVVLPPSPCAAAGGRPMPGRGGQPACFVRKARLLPPGPCAQAGGREAREVKSGRQVCVRAGGGKTATDAWDTK
jgi:hypothetical protein